MTHNTPQSSGAKGWFNERFPLFAQCRDYLTNYQVPKNLNTWYVFGFLALLVLCIQLLSGLVLLMHYKPDAQKAFQSLEYLMSEVPLGWLVRYMHSTGASMLFVVVYLHMARGFLYGSYRKPRELVWILGVFVFLCLMAEAFLGYLLPWGQMSYWAAQVITEVLTAVPRVGADLALWVRGDYGVSDVTLGRFFAFHVLLVPLVFGGLVVLHVLALHAVKGSVLSSKLAEAECVPFHPYYTVRDVFAAVVFLLVFVTVVFFAPEMGGYFLEYNNFIPADPLRTPEHIAPMWYFSPFYSMLRANTVSMLGVDAKAWGALCMGASVLILFFLPWLDRSPVAEMSKRPCVHKVFYAVFFSVFLVLGYLGLRPFSELGLRVSQCCTVLYFVFFLTMPWWSRWGRFR